MWGVILRRTFSLVLICLETLLPLLIPIMSITCFGNAVLICFAFLSTLTLTQGSIRLAVRQNETSKVFELDDADAGRSDQSNARVDRSVDPNKSFLAGEDTPVWIAHYANPNNKELLIYEKLEKGIVKEAIDYWKSSEFNGISKGKRSADDDVNVLKGDRESFDDVRSSVSRVLQRSKREVTSAVYHPLVMVVMEYGNTWPSDKKDERKLILERIIYALAYWNGVDMQLRPIANPSIRLRVAGIVIGRDRDDTHHLFETYSSTDYLHYAGTVHRMGEYWGDRMHQKLDFQRGTYNIVALMTDASGYHKKSTDGSAFSDHLLCDRDNPGTTGVLVTSDNLEFSSLQQSLSVMARMLGHGSDNNPACNYRSEWNNRAWNRCDSDSIQKSLVSNGWCMERPMEFHDPGKPVERILPGMLISLDRQCKVYGWSSASACPWQWMCMSLMCRDSDFDQCQERKDPALEGSDCGVGMICVNGSCGSNTVLSGS